MPDETKKEELDSEETSKKVAEPEKQQLDDVKDDKEPDYRPKTERKPKEQETVPLSKYMKVKNRLNELKRTGVGSDVNSQTNEADLEEIAKELDLDPSKLKKLFKVFSKSDSPSKSEVEKMIKDIVTPVLSSKQTEQNDKNFENHFNNEIVKKFPHVAKNKEAVKILLFNEEFKDILWPDLINRFFPAGTESKKTKEDIEGGSQGGNRGESIDFGKMTAEQHKRVLADPDMRKKYYAWQDSKGL